VNQLVLRLLKSLVPRDRYVSPDAVTAF